MTTISWTRGDDGSSGKSWNPIKARHRQTGKVGWFCTPVHEGCVPCYAGTMNERTLYGRYGTGVPYKAQHLDDHEFFLDEDTLREPLAWRKGYRVFVCSMTDLHGPWVPPTWKDRIKAVEAACPQHQFIELTKRPEAQRDYLGDPALHARVAFELGLLVGGDRVISIDMARMADRLTQLQAANAPLPNVWAGPSCSRQPHLEQAGPVLISTRVAKRIVSLEPLLGPMDIGRFIERRRDGRPRIDQVFVGFQSGAGVQSQDVELIRSIIRQCRDAGVACFVKQLGHRPLMWAAQGERGRRTLRPLTLRDRKGEDPAEWPEDLRVREFCAPMPGAERPGAPAEQLALGGIA